MADFAGMVLTKHGADLLAKVHGGAQLVITRGAVGSGVWPEAQNPEDMTDLAREEMSLSVQSFEALAGGVAKLVLIIDNSGLDEGFTLSEIGIYATDPDRGEILYAVAYAGAATDFVPGKASAFQKILDIYIVSGPAGSLQVTIDGSTMTATMEDLEDHNADPEAHAALAARIKANRMRLDVLFQGGRYLLEEFYKAQTLLEDISLTVDTAAGSDLIDCDDASQLQAGRRYVIHQGSVEEEVEIAEVVSASQVRAAANLVNSFVGAALSRCSLSIDWTVGLAEAADGDVYLAGPVTLGGADMDKTILLKQTAGAAAPAVEFRDAANPAWTPCAHVLTRSSNESGYDEVVYSLPARGEFHLRMVAAAEAVLDYLAIYEPDQLRSSLSQILAKPLAEIEYPTVDTTDHRLPMTPQAAVQGGAVSIAAGTPIIINEETQPGVLVRHVLETPDWTSADLATDATYYLRVQVVDGSLVFYVQQGADDDEIPGSLLGTPDGGTGGGFDTTKLDALLAKITTGNAGTVPTVRALANAARLVATGTISVRTSRTLNWTTLNGSAITLDWGRKPTFTAPSLTWFRSLARDVDGTDTPTDVGDLQMTGVLPQSNTPNRYHTGDIKYAYDDSDNSDGWVRVGWHVEAI